jgi:PHD/YefM family antitoxin component YafN of YafNO toxin-antitoxin module
MFRSEDIRPVTDFVRNHKRHHERLRETGRPEVLTINGVPELVVQDVRAYEREAEEAQRLREENHALRERLEELETLVALDEAHAEMERGEGQSVEEALPALRERLGMGVAAR